MIKARGVFFRYWFQKFIIHSRRITTFWLVTFIMFPRINVTEYLIKIHVNLAYRMMFTELSPSVTKNQSFSVLILRTTFTRINTQSVPVVCTCILSFSL